MKKLLLISLSWWLAAPAWAATNATPLTAAQLLDKFAQTQDRLLSCAYTVTTEEKFSVEQGANGRTFYEAEVRMAATCAASRELLWGTTPSWSVPRTDAYYYHRFGDGNTSGTYAAWGRRRGTLTVNLNAVDQRSPSFPRRSIMTHNNAAYLFGFFGGDEDRCDVVLKDAQELRVRDRREPVNGVQCHVLDARRTTRFGSDARYTLWFDPVHGYNIARADVQTGPEGDRAGPSSDFLIKQVTFGQIDGAWVPAKAESEYLQRSPKGNVTGKVQVRITAMRLNPDHKASKSFALDDIPDGTTVRFIGVGGRAGSQIAWQTGRVMDGDGRVLWTPGSLNGLQTNRPPPTGR